MDLDDFYTQYVVCYVNSHNELVEINKQGK